MLRHRERMEENGIAPLPWEGKRSAAAAPDAEVADKPTRRRFSPSYKLRVVEEADRCTEPGEAGRLLRREGLYSSHLTTWRKAVRSGWLRALSKRRGRKPSERNPLEGKVRKLERENTRLEKELDKARLIMNRIDRQGEGNPRPALHLWTLQHRRYRRCRHTEDPSSDPPGRPRLPDRIEAGRPPESAVAGSNSPPSPGPGVSALAAPAAAEINKGIGEHIYHGRADRRTSLSQTVGETGGTLKS